MHIVHIGYHYPPNKPSLEDFLEDYYTLKYTNEALVRIGVSVTVLHRFWKNHHQIINGVRYVLMADKYTERLSILQIPKKLHQKVNDLQPDVVHSHNLRDVFRISHLKKQISDIPLVIQNHGETPISKWHWLLRMKLKRVDAVVFAIASQATVWRKKAIIDKHTSTFGVMEGASLYKRTQTIGRNETKEGVPVIIWTGNLDRNKDPITILNAFEQFAEKVPKARLYMAYRFDPLLSDVESRINKSDSLKNKVMLLGELSKTDMEAYFNSAHYFVQGSAREASGYSLIEALSCGTVPIVTNIPSFMHIMGDGKVGHTFEIGSDKGLFKALMEANQNNWQAQSDACLLHYEKALSFDRIAEDMKAVYMALTC